MKCSTCKDREARKGQRNCDPCNAAAQADYRKRADRKREGAAHYRGFEEGIAICLKFLREQVGDRALTGYQSAKAIEKAVLSSESAEVLARRAFLKSLTPIA